jgi:hypothetical protein
MLQKPAVLYVEYMDGKIELLAGEKGDVYSASREKIHETNDSGNPGGICRVIGFALNGALKDKRWKNLPVEIAPENGGEGDEDEAKELRKVLREAGVSYSPRAGLDHLRKQVAELKGE